MSTEPSIEESLAETYRKTVLSNHKLQVEKHWDCLEIGDGDKVLLGTSNLTGPRWCGSVWYYDRPSLVPHQSFAGTEFEAGVTDVKFLDNGVKVIVSDDIGALSILNLVEVLLNTKDKKFYFSQAAWLMQHEDVVSSIDVSTDSCYAISGSHDKSIKYWDLHTELCEKTFSPSHSHIVTSVSMQQNKSELFLSSSLDGDALLWDIRKERPASLILHDESGVTSTVWINNDLAAFGTQQGQVKLVDIRNKKELITVAVNDRPVHKMKYNCQLDCLAVCTDDVQVVVLQYCHDVPSPLYTSDQHTGFVRGLAWDSNNILFSCGWDQKLLSHNIQDRINKE